ncbi:MAG: (Fe-S)-binding protein [Ignavibacteriales bacterium]|nr:(Fe-S)-binding protein [Ignavibacteriales bacterium]
MAIVRIILFAIVSISAFVFFIKNVGRIISYIKLGKPENRFDNIRERIQNVVSIAFGQSKLLREPVAGTIHFLIFWGFILFGIAVTESLVQGVFRKFTFAFTGPFYLLITGVQDILGILVLLSILFSLYRRFVQKVPRLQVEGKGKYDAALVLFMISLVVLSMFGQNISHVAKSGFVLTHNELRPLSAYLAGKIFPANGAGADVSFEIFWWLHIIFVLGFLNYLPYSKHFHIISSIPNVFFSGLPGRKNVIQPLNLEDENAESFGVDDVQKFTWKQLLDGYACTECGRCTSVCPAANTGKTLSPRNIIVEIKKRTNTIAPLVLGGITEGDVIADTLVHHHITDKELWQCTTCNACVQECPVMIEHVDSIVDMRRHLVLTESTFPSELNNVFRSLEVNGTPWAFNQSERADWAEGLQIKTMAEDKETEYLFWVGCAGSFDNRYKKVSRAFASIMQKAGVNFRILGTEEKCNGDTARRLGNEYLAQQMMQENIEKLNGYGVKKIVTACPHCFNSIKNEYKQFGGNFEVLHHSEMIEALLEAGSIQVKKTGVRKVTFHDSCYLGRYNDTYEAPRETLKAIPGVTLTEMERNKSRGFCCGAGGGRMFLEDVEGGRINEERSREAIATGADTIGTACPFCMTMMNDGVKAHDKADSVAVKDIAEIVFENLA